MRRFFSTVLVVLAAGCATTKGSTSSANSAPVTLAAKPCPPPPAALTEAEIPERLKAAHDYGYLWRVSKDGRTSFLYGTVHVADIDHALPGPKMLEALRASRAIALELDPSKAQAQLQSKGGVGPSFTFDDAERARLKAVAERACLSWEKLETFPAPLQVMTVSLVELQRSGLFAAWGIDQVLAGMAQGMKVPLLGLETLEEQTSALANDGDAKTKELYLGMLQAIERDEGGETVVKLFNAWAASDLKALEAFSEEMRTLSPQFDRRVISERNQRMAKRIAQVHTQQNTFFAIGSLHMTGAEGLPALLVKQGFTVERVAFAQPL